PVPVGEVTHADAGEVVRQPRLVHHAGVAYDVSEAERAAGVDDDEEPLDGDLECSPVSGPSGSAGAAVGSGGNCSVSGSRNVMSSEGLRPITVLVIRSTDQSGWPARIEQAIIASTTGARPLSTGSSTSSKKSPIERPENLSMSMRSLPVSPTFHG